MPIPEPKAGEEQDAYMGRCMSFMKGEKDKFKTQEQRVAICLNTFRRKSEDVIGKIDRILEAVVVGDVGKKIAGDRQCPKGQRWCAKCMACIDVREAPGTGVPAFQCPGCKESFYTRGYGAAVTSLVGPGGQKANLSGGIHESVDAEVEVYKAKDKKWYVYWEDKHGADHYGPFKNMDAGLKAVSKRFGNPGFFASDDSGNIPVPKKVKKIHEATRGREYETTNVDLSNILTFIYDSNKDKWSKVKVKDLRTLEKKMGGKVAKPETYALKLQIDKMKVKKLYFYLDPYDELIYSKWNVRWAWSQKEADQEIQDSFEAVDKKQPWGEKSFGKLKTL